MRNNNFYVITGGPGVGKTTLINALHQGGFNILPEAARSIIKEELQAGRAGVPWKDKKRYAERMLNASMSSYIQAMAENTAIPTFFDRGIPDAVCYMKMENLQFSLQELDQLNDYRYNKTVFILPPWMEIYENDDERKQTWQQAASTFDIMRDTYLDFGYQVTEVPKMPVSSRVEFILQAID